MWNFSGRQNAEQGFYSWDSKNGNWITGIGFIDKMLLGYSAADETKVMKEDRGRNAYYLLPFIFGLIGLFYHFKKRPEEALSIMVLFLMTGLAITVYTNQPPNEPRERDYVLVGSFFTFCIWMGMGVAAIYEYIKNKMPQVPAAALASALVLVAPVLMGTQNYDDMSRRGHTAASDYASNFLNSVGKNAIIFTYGDNDTYPLWYAQEVENIRPDVRVVNLSLIQVDWYIDHLRRKVNESPYIKMTLPKESYNGKKMNQVVYYPSGDKADFASVQSIMQFLGKQQGDQMYVPTNKLYIPIDSAQMLAQGGIQPTDAGKMLPQIPFEMPMKKSGQYQYTTKGDLALVDIVASNINDRPIYFATTIPDPNENFLGLAGFTQLEGLALRIVPIPYGEDKRFAGIGAMSLGNVNDDIIYDNMMHKWKWGNFDKAPTFVDSKYGPSVQSMRMAFIRGARSLLDRGDTTRAVQMIDKYFEAFPNFNFPYDYSILEFMRLYVDAKAWDKAKPQAQILADNLEDQLAFCMTLDDSALKSSEFYRDFRIALSAKDQLLGFVTKAGDTAFKAELDKRFEAYKTNGDNQSEQ